MKLKQRPDDFRVEERTDLEPRSAGSFAFYRLEKRDWTTPDAVAAVRQRWTVDARRVSFGGLKDRHAHTAQYLTIHHGPARNLSHDRLTLTFLGYLDRPYTAADIRSNLFTVTLRDLSTADAAHVEAALPQIANVGVPNYFDDQRFGSVTDGGDFIARRMVLGDFEAALRLALLSPYEFDRHQERREKDVLTARWGDWPAARAELSSGHARGIVDYLVQRPADFRGACARLRPELQGMYLAAWQSHLWNRMLARWLTERVPMDQLVPVRLKAGDVVFPTSIPTEHAEEWDRLFLPLPSARLKFDPQAPWAGVVTAVMSEEGIPLSEMKVKGMRQPFFSKGNRAARLPLTGLAHISGDDDLNPGRRKIALSFELPRGCYATMVVKRLTV